MRRFEVTYTDGHVDVIEAAECEAREWGAAFIREETRQSKAFNARPGDMVVKQRTFLIIAGRLIDRVRELV